VDPNVTGIATLPDVNTPTAEEVRFNWPGSREVSIDCDRCGKPIATATSSYKREWRLGGRSDGGITPEGQLRGGIYAGNEGPHWWSRIWDVSPEGQRAGETREGGARHKLVCKRQHRDRRGRRTLVQQTVTRETVTRVCDAAIAASGRPCPDYVGPHVVLGVTWSGCMRARITLAELR
jgi:hypothetical protein